jgi:hypothetical protein
MSLTSSLGKEITAQTKDNGRDYFRSGAVKIVSGNQWQVQATIAGKQLRRVQINRNGDSFQPTCDCSYFLNQRQICSHIWATLLAAEKKNYLTGGEVGPTRLLGQLAQLQDDEEDDLDDFEDEEDDFDSDWSAGRYPPPAPARPAPAKPNWQQTLEELRRSAGAHPGPAWPAEAEPVYLIDVDATGDGRGLQVELALRTRKRNGDWTVPKPRRITNAQVATLPDAADRRVLALLIGAKQEDYYSYHYPIHESGPRFRLTPIMQSELVPLLCATGRCLLRVHQELFPLQWDDGPPWCLQVKVVQETEQLRVSAELVRAGQAMAAGQLILAVSGGLAFTRSHAARLDDAGSFGWLALLNQPMLVPRRDQDRWLAEVLTLPRLPPLELPPELHFDTVAPPLQCRVRIAPPKQPRHDNRLEANLFFRYGEQEVSADAGGEHFLSSAKRLLIRRDPAGERQATSLLHQLGFRQDWRSPYGSYSLASRNLSKVVQALTAQRWLVEADGKLYRQAGNFHMEVRSGIDWFELHGAMQFGDQQATLPELLAAVRKGENSVRLGDGTFGMLPEDWLKKHGLLASTGKAEGDHLRYSRVQVGLLDALLAAQPEARGDASFERARQELRRFDGIAAAAPPAGFAGQLRGYQKDGLGWLHFLERFGFGGCLADDMGLGKTVMVLALLEARRELRQDKQGADRPPPSLAIVPRSLIFNWLEEAKRFAPRLRVLDHSGVGRLAPGPHFHDHDLILTTYGILRRDILALKDFAFDYCVLDEAQAIKNARSDSAKAVRLLQAGHRLALSGTPVENHLGELWSLLDFLNPGMLGSALKVEGGWRNPSGEARQLLSRALRPVILRRTKEQVAQDLPAKTEQTIHCELDAQQRRLYNELRDHFRQSLLQRVARDGIQKSKMHILEALLRLRQAACHPGLIDKDKAGESSAKLDTLLPQLTEVIEEGHKALVFSQFTSLLAIVRDRLDQEHIPYQYLDGRTRDRQAKVDAFQNDPDCKLFLISLKAGGLGLNLTAAEYVFLLDPWWNPAVEAQAIDRAHRIGQDKPVFAYRLIAKDTVEEKVLELQRHKRALADAIISADNNLIRDLGREDLELLLS